MVLFFKVSKDALLALTTVRLYWVLRSFWVLNLHGLGFIELPVWTFLRKTHSYHFEKNILGSKYLEFCNWMQNTKSNAPENLLKRFWNCSKSSPLHRIICIDWAWFSFYEIYIPKCPVYLILRTKHMALEFVFWKIIDLSLAPMMKMIMW